jgi:hypothetical protein
MLHANIEWFVLRCEVKEMFVRITLKYWVKEMLMRMLNVTTWQYWVICIMKWKKCLWECHIKILSERNVYENLTWKYWVICIERCEGERNVYENVTWKYWVICVKMWRWKKCLWECYIKILSDLYEDVKGKKCLWECYMEISSDLYEDVKVKEMFMRMLH